MAQKQLQAAVLDAESLDKNNIFPPACTPANIIAQIAVYKLRTVTTPCLIIRAPKKNINDNKHDINVWPNPNIIPDKLPYFTAIFNAYSKAYEYLFIIRYCKLKLFTVFMYIIDQITAQCVFLCTLSELLCMPWLNDICNLPDNIMRGNTAKATNVICQLKAKAIAKPIKIVVAFSTMSPIK